MDVFLARNDSRGNNNGTGYLLRGQYAGGKKGEKWTSISSLTPYSFEGKKRRAGGNFSR